MTLPTLPSEHRELPFLRYWSTELLDPRDPQNDRWLSLELQQVAHAAERVRLLQRFHRIRGASILDVGCQTGAVPIALSRAGAIVTGIDVSEPLIEGARIRAACYETTPSFCVGKAEQLPFRDGAFDLVVLFDVLEHVEDAKQTLREAARVLAPGGVLYLQAPNRWSPRWFWSDPHYRMTGISVLPPSLGHFYVTRLRGRPRYDVGVFPVGSTVLQWLQAMHCSVLEAPGSVAQRFASMFTIVAKR